MTYDQFVDSSMNITALRRKVQSDKDNQFGDDQTDSEDIMANGRKGAGVQINAVEDAAKVIAAVCLALDKNPEMVNFTPIDGIIKVVHQ